LTTTDTIGGIGEAERIAAGGSGLGRTAGTLIIAAIGFNAFLCFLNTRGVAISNIDVILSEVLLISAAVLVCRNHFNFIHISVLALIVFYTVAISALRYANAPDGGFDPKISRDLMIPVVFFLFGKAVDDLRVADRIVSLATAILLAFALFEYFFLDAFLKVFGIAEYYIARGTVEASDWARNVSQGLMVSGLRPADQGRTLFPFLGGHRISSLFLEPSTLGNYGALVALWAALRSRMEGRLFVGLALGGLALLILSDTRFNAYFLLLALPVLLAPPRLTTPAVFILPFTTMLALYLLGASSADSFNSVPIVEGREAYDRLLYSGRVLFDFNAYNWLGLEVSRAQTFDSGYGYVISNIGIVGFAALWLLFMSLQGSNRFFYAFRNVLAVYFAALLCISASQFTIKIAALLWFLLGVLSVVKATDGGQSRRIAAVAQI
jgi:putative polymerase